MGPDGTLNQERLCWREPATIYWIRTYVRTSFLKYFHETEMTAELMNILTIS
jgi:hypothetical protein